MTAAELNEIESAARRGDCLTAATENLAKKIPPFKAEHELLVDKTSY